MERERTESALVLFSGGQDSTTCLAWALDRFARVETIGFDYRQRHAAELGCREPIRTSLRGFGDWGARLGDDHLVDLGVVSAISETALTRDTEIEMGESGLPTTFVPGRNLVFFTVAGAVAYRRGLRHIVGGMCETDYSGYPDCRDDTIKALQLTLNLGDGESVRAAYAVDVAGQGADLDIVGTARRCGAGRDDPHGIPQLLSRRSQQPARMGAWLRCLPGLRPARGRLGGLSWGEPTDVTIGEAVAVTAARLRAAKVEPAWREARLLVGIAAAVEPHVVVGYPERSLDAEVVERVVALVDRRCAGEPVSRIVGRREFWSLSFALSPDTLDPRADSETLVAAVLEAVGDRGAPLRILDFGVGSGCLLLALLSELPHASGVGIDISWAACATARANAAALGLEGRAAFVTADWGAALTGRFDIIVSNPPYIPDAEIATLEPEVALFDPRRALAGGADGLDAYRALIPGLAEQVVPGGLCAVEVGAGQADAVARWMGDAGLEGITFRHDLGGIPRCVVARKRL